MVDSRLKNDPPTLFHCFVDITSPHSNGDNALKFQFMYPDEFLEKELILKDLPGFCYPCDVASDGVEYSTFVLTDLDSKFRFGFCRYPSQATHCLCLVSYLPWFKTFYSILDKVSLIFGDITDKNKNDVVVFLKTINSQMIPDPGSQMFIKFQTKTYTFVSPETTLLPTIPDNRNLTKYYAKITPENMVSIFISMLFERRIIVTSEKLSVLTAVVHGSVTLLYPMQWQHIYVPILPPHLIDYVCAPMPFLLGIHSSMMEKVRHMPMNEVVILNADTNQIELPDDNLDVTFPKSIAAKLSKRLGRTEKASRDYVSSLFLDALADLIGGYRDALKYVDSTEGGKIVFDEELFLSTRTGSRKTFLESIHSSQSFRQFIHGRLDMLNDGVEFVDIFEKAIIKRADNAAAETKFDAWKDKMKKGGGVLKKTVEGKYSHLKGIASEIEVKEEVKEFRKKIKEKVKRKKKEKDATDALAMKRNNSLPTHQNVKMRVSRHSTLSDGRPISLYVAPPKRDVQKPGRTPPPRPPQPTTPTSQVQNPLVNIDSSSAKLPRKLLDIASPEVSTSHSMNDIVGLISKNSSRSSSMDYLSSSESESGDEQNSSGSYFNPAFKEVTEQDLLFENPADNAPCSLEMQPIENQADNAPCSLEMQPIEKPPPISNIKRAVPVIRRKVPPARPPPISPEKQRKVPPGKPPPPPVKTPPNRPLQIPTDKTQLIEISSPGSASEMYVDITFDEQNEAFIETDIENSTALVADDSKERPIVLPSSPFYTPSSDLLDLNQSLFTETMKSLSEDTRSLITSNGNSTIVAGFSSSATESTNPFKPDYSMRNSGFNDKFEMTPLSTSTTKEDDEEDNNLHRSPVLSKPPKSGNSGTNSPSTMDPFASCFEEAKKDFKLTNKR